MFPQGFKIYEHCRYIENQIRVKSSKSCINGDCMRKHYDFSKARKNPYAARLKKSITIRLDEDAIAFFKSMAEETRGVTLSSAKALPNEHELWPRTQTNGWQRGVEPTDALVAIVDEGRDVMRGIKRRESRTRPCSPQPATGVS